MEVMGVIPDMAVESIEPLHLGDHGAKYVIYTRSGARHELQVYERGGCPSRQFEFEVDGDVMARGICASGIEAFNAGLRLISRQEIESLRDPYYDWARHASPAYAHRLRSHAA